MEAKEELEELRLTVSTLGNELVATRRALQQSISQTEVEKGKASLLRQQLRQELAYILFLEGRLGTHGETPNFNSLSKEERASFFKKVDSQL
jgi:hypothetical protein